MMKEVILCGDDNNKDFLIVVMRGDGDGGRGNGSDER